MDQEEYERLLREGYRAIGKPHLAPKRQGRTMTHGKFTSYQRKFGLAMNAARLVWWDHIPGWSSIEDLREDHEAEWTNLFPDVPCPRIDNGNAPWDEGAIKISQHSMDLFGYAWMVAFYVHRRRGHGRSVGFNPRMAGIFLIVVQRFEPDCAEFIHAGMRRMSMTVRWA